jgi:transaldolase
MKRNKLKTIRDFGQSVWLDFFDREIMDSGKLEKLIENDGVSGVTANPSIFEKAISSSSDYDQDIAAFSNGNNSNEDIFFNLAIKDIKRAADFFISVYDETHGEDGFVSLEVSPHLALDTEGTIKEARKFWNAINRKNVMIKIPGTAEGLPAIRKCISEGININITLLFGLPRYKQVTDAYITGLEDRIKNNEPIDQMSSVASFFLSRIDVLIDPLLEEKGWVKSKAKWQLLQLKKPMKFIKKCSIAADLESWKQTVQNANVFYGPVPVVKIHRSAM